MEMSKKFDKRLLDRRIRKGELTRDELKAHLNALENKEDEAVVMEVTLEAVREEREEQQEGND